MKVQVYTTRVVIFFFLSFRTKDRLQILENFRDISGLDENDYLISKFEKDVFCKLTRETLNSLYIDKLFLLGTKSYCSVCLLRKKNPIKIKRKAKASRNRIQCIHYFTCSVEKEEHKRDVDDCQISKEDHKN